MTEQLLETRNKPRFSRPRQAWNGFAVRVYRASPEDVQLQLRCGPGFASVSLSFEEARLLAAKLLKEAGAVVCGFAP